MQRLSLYIYNNCHHNLQSSPSQYHWYVFKKECLNFTNESKYWNAKIHPMIKRSSQILYIFICVLQAQLYIWILNSLKKEFLILDMHLLMKNIYRLQKYLCCNFLPLQENLYRLQLKFHAHAFLHKHHLFVLIEGLALIFSWVCQSDLKLMSVSVWCDAKFYFYCFCYQIYKNITRFRRY